MSALVTGLAQGGVSLLGGLMGNRAQEKAAHKQFLRQDALDEQSDRRHLDALNEANAQQAQMFGWHLEGIREANAEVRAFNDRAFAANAAMDGFVPGIDFDRLTKEATAAGYNPLTVVKYGLGGAYQRTPPQHHAYQSFFAPSAAPSALAPMRAQSGQAVAANPTNAWGEAVAAGLSAFNNYDPTRGLRQQLEVGLAQSQIRNLDSDTSRNLRLMSAPNYTATGRRVTTGGFGGAARAPATDGGLQQEDAKVTNLHTGFWEQAPWFADVASWAERHGEPAEWVISPLSVLADLSHNIDRGARYLDRTVGARSANPPASYLKDTVSWIVDALDPTKGGHNVYR